EDQRGPGVQRIAPTVTHLVDAVRTIRRSGGHYIPTPRTYHDMLPERMKTAGFGPLDEDIDVLRELGILVDGSESNQYLLQIFMSEAAATFGDPQAGPLFFELIQRKGDYGFGAGNFRALFDSIERQQELEGRLTST